MASHFQNYVTTLNRIRLSEMIDHYAIQYRAVRLQPSLVFNPVTNRCYKRRRDLRLPAYPRRDRRTIIARQQRQSL